MDSIGEELQGWPLSYRQVVNRCHGGVSAATISNIVIGKRRTIAPETIDALADALNLDPKLIRRAIDASIDQEWRLPSKVQQLTPEGWKQLLDFADFLLRQEHH